MGVGGKSRITGPQCVIERTDFSKIQKEPADKREMFYYNDKIQSLSATMGSSSSSPPGDLPRVVTFNTDASLLCPWTYTPAFSVDGLATDAGQPRHQL